MINSSSSGRVLSISTVSQYSQISKYTTTVESSLFVGDQCSWISWFTRTNEFTSPWTYDKVINCLTLECNKPVTNLSTYKQTSNNLITKEYWPPHEWKWFHSTVLTNIIYVDTMENINKNNAKINTSRYTGSTIITFLRDLLNMA